MSLFRRKDTSKNYTSQHFFLLRNEEIDCQIIAAGSSCPTDELSVGIHRPVELPVERCLGFNRLKKPGHSVFTMICETTVLTVAGGS